ncbi:nucleoside/nucleotide kinase family protein [Oceanicola sp. D3]|uniref:nucleoside/nucleotide kinase family protein n=1 Tax=Oceanicola sp. D3 TaxID=2587163 RepID=UPI00111F8F11|nr:nucleoside/nucleotide kinase family protein [Oceanicola sp. D3]QDC07855.1 nucleoside/nucleotide kinase family protein [Oceanicola sp. D3]
MTRTLASLPALQEAVLATPKAGRRRVVALAGAPASGKSTLADALCTSLKEAGERAQVVPMDGFHLHNPILVERGLLARKGAPETFDAPGFLHLVQRLRDEAEVAFPLFDRARDIAIAGAGLVDEACDTVIVEGNYLLFDRPVWRDLRPHWDLAVRIDVEIATLRERLVARWHDYGLSGPEATARAEGNDLANAQLVAEAMLPADITVTTSG